MTPFKLIRHVAGSLRLLASAIQLPARAVSRMVAPMSPAPDTSAGDITDWADIAAAVHIAKRDRRSSLA